MSVALRCAAALVFALQWSLPAAMANDLTHGQDRLLNSTCPTPESCPVLTFQQATARSGIAITIWSHVDGMGGPIRASRYDPASDQWTAPHTFTGEYGSQPKIGFDRHGNAIAIWMQVERSNDNFICYNAVRYARFVAATASWSRAATITDIIGCAVQDEAQLSVSANGDAVVALDQSYENEGLFRFHAASGTWHALAGGSKGGSAQQRVAIDDDGNIVQARVFHTGFIDFAAWVDVSYYNAASRTWRFERFDHEPYDIYSFDRIYPIALSVAIDDQGYATVMWLRVTSLAVSLSHDIRSARYHPGRQTWTMKRVPKASNSLTEVTTMSPDRRGNVTAVWAQPLNGYLRMLSSRYSSTTGAWSRPVEIQQGNFHTRHPDVATDRSGNVFASWSQRTDSGNGTSENATFRTMVSRFSVTTGRWCPPHLIQDANVRGFRPDIGVDDTGRALVVWPQYAMPQRDGVRHNGLRADRVMPTR